MDADTMTRGQNYLEHYGIKGMRWGVRRSDAQLARARGEKAAARVAKKKTSEIPKKTSSNTDGDGSDDYNKASSARSQARSSGTKTLSNQQLRDINDRIRLESEYRKLNAAPQSKFKQHGKKFLEQYLENEIKNIAKGNPTNTTTYRVGSMLLATKTKGKHRK